jgi:hypothetical protein
MPLFYKSGEEIRTGDRVMLTGNLGEIEFVADPVLHPDDWLVIEHGAGVMIVVPKAYGRVFIEKPNEDEDLEFVSRPADSF